MSESPRVGNHLFASVLFHVIVLAVLIVSFDFNAPMPVLQNSDKDMKVLNAVVMDAPPGPLPPPAVIPKPEPKKVEAKPLPPPAPPPPKPVEQKKVVEEVKPKPNAIAIPDKHKKQKELLAKQLLSDLEKEVTQKKKAKNKEVEREFEKELEAQTSKSLEQQLKKEQDRIASVQSQKARGEVNKYKALILQAISRQWVVPVNINKKLISELLIRTSPGGMVIDVQIVRSSGDVALDRSARAAVFKASPLPVPSDSNAFESFRQFILKVKPENILDS